MARTRKWLVRRVGVLVVLTVLGVAAGVGYIPDARAAPSPNLTIGPGTGGACMTFGTVTFTAASVLFPKPGIPNGSVQAKGSVTNTCGFDVTIAKVLSDSIISGCSYLAPTPKEFSSAGTGLSAGMTLIFTGTAQGLCYSCNALHIPQQQTFTLTSTIQATAVDSTGHMVTAFNPPTGGSGALVNDFNQLPLPC